jgi:hypothetical protein
MTMSDILNRIEFNVSHWVRHWNHKIVGVSIVVVGGETIFLPCMPTLEYDYVSRKIQSIDVFDGYGTYENTVRYLEQFKAVYQYNTQPLYCIVNEEDDVMGIELETEQFVEIRPYVKWNADMLPKKEQPNPNDVDRALYQSSQSSISTSPVLLNDQKYLTFRSHIRNQLREFKNQAIRQSIIQIIQGHNPTSLDSIVDLLKELKEDVLAELNIPDLNHWGANNNVYFYTRLADELLRFTRIRIYMLENTVQFTEIEYRIHHDETLIHESNIHDYYKGLE